MYMFIQIKKCTMQFISEGSVIGEKAKSNDDEQIIGVRFYRKSSAKKC